MDEKKAKIQNMSQVSNPYGCAFCQNSFSNAKSLVAHVQTTHGQVKSSEEHIENLNKNNQDLQVQVISNQKDDFDDTILQKNDFDEDENSPKIHQDIKLETQNTPITLKIMKNLSCKKCDKTFLTRVSHYKHLK